MNAERLSFGQYKVPIPESGMPDRTPVNGAPPNGVPERLEHVVTPKESKSSNEPTESQLFFRDMFRSSKELTPYQKDRPAPKLDAWKNAMKEALHDPINYAKHIGDHIMAVDMDLRGGADKEYNQLGNLGQRAKRVAIMTGNIVPYLAFDVLTSIPSALIIESERIKLKKDEKATRGLIAGLTKLNEVANDKVVTAWADINVRKLTGEKVNWVHEGPDKLADTLQTALPDYYKDMVNGPVLQSVSNALFQVPIAGALFEQIWTRISLWQEQSALNKGLAKSVYMGVGTAWGVWRELENGDQHTKRSWSSVIARKILGKDKKAE